MVNISIEYENEDLVVVNKPAGLPVYSTKKHEGEESVVAWFLKRYPQAKTVGDQDRPGVVHRLDKQTSGLLVLAKNQAAFDYLKNLFKTRKINKEYSALVYGEMPRHAVITKPLTKIGHEGQSRVRVDEEGKEAVTEYWSLQRFTLPLPPPERSRRAGLPSREGNKKRISSPLMGEDKGGGVDEFTLLKVKLHTGRTHQIRVHLASEKHPVMGDNLYGKPLSQKLADILSRQFLHASRLEFKLPDGTWLEVESDLPKDLRSVLSKLKA